VLRYVTASLQVGG